MLQTFRKWEIQFFKGQVLKTDGFHWISCKDKMAF